MLASSTTSTLRSHVVANHRSRARRTQPIVKATATTEMDDVVAASSTTTLKTDVYALAACSSRGERATSTQRENMRVLVGALENPTASPATSELLSGAWELVYEESGHPFRSSPFFWAVGKLLADSANFFYDAHEHQTSMFGGGCGTCLQMIDGKAETLTSDVIVKASFGVPLLGFAPLVSAWGSVITKGKMRVVDENTVAVPLGSLTTTVRQDDTSILPAFNFLNGTTVPVGDVMGRIADAQDEVFMRITYLDDDMRISEIEDGTTLVYRRKM